MSLYMFQLSPKLRPPEYKSLPPEYNVAKIQRKVSKAQCLWSDKGQLNTIQSHNSNTYEERLLNESKVNITKVQMHMIRYWVIQCYQYNGRQMSRTPIRN